MKVSLIAIISALVIPGFALAAYDDVTLTTDVVLSINSITLNVSGSSAAIETITAGSTSFSVTMQTGSVIQVTSPARATLSSDSGETFVITNECNSGESILKLSATGPATITITPSSTVCSGSATNSSSGGGGGGGGAIISVDKPTGPFSVSVNSDAAVTKSRLVNLTLSAGSNVTRMAISSKFADLQDAALVDYKTAAEWDLCSKLGGTIKEDSCAQGLYTVYVKFYTQYGQSSDTYSDSIEYNTAGVQSQAPVAQTQTQVQTPVSTQTGGTAQPLVLTKTFNKGVSHAEIKSIQQALNAHGFIIAENGPGSPGNETNFFGALTEKAVQKFQAQYGIVNSGTPQSTGYGRIGPKTKTKMQEIFSQ